MVDTASTRACGRSTSRSIRPAPRAGSRSIEGPDLRRARRPLRCRALHWWLRRPWSQRRVPAWWPRPLPGSTGDSIRAAAVPDARSRCEDLAAADPLGPTAATTQGHEPGPVATPSQRVGLRGSAPGPRRTAAAEALRGRSCRRALPANQGPTRGRLVRPSSHPPLGEVTSIWGSRAFRLRGRARSPLFCLWHIRYMPAAKPRRRVRARWLLAGCGVEPLPVPGFFPRREPQRPRHRALTQRSRPPGGEEDGIAVLSLHHSC